MTFGTRLKCEEKIKFDWEKVFCGGRRTTVRYLIADRKGELIRFIRTLTH